MKKTLSLTFACLLLAAGPTHAAGDAAKAPMAAADSSMSEAEVRKVDTETKRITLRHGEIKSLGMPAGMTMVFRVKDPAMLDKVKAGDKVRFTAEKLDGAFTVTSIETAK